MRRILVCAVLLLAARVARGDGAYVKAGGGGVIALQNNDVQMVWEAIDAAVERADLLAEDDRLIVTVTYRFRNDTNRAIAFDMGFPVRWDESEFYQQEKSCVRVKTKSPVSAFSVSVDGEAVPTALRRGRKPIRQGCLSDIEEAAKREEKANQKAPFYHEFYVWPMAFAPHQARTVVNRFQYSARATGHDDDDYSGDNRWVYILKTGSLWHGTIKRLTIRLHFGDRGCVCGFEDDEGGSCLEGTSPELTNFNADPFKLSTKVPDSVEPSGARLRRLADGTDEVIWKLRDYEPDRDVRVGYETARAAWVEVRAAIEKLNLEKASRATLERARETLLALHGIGDRRFAGRSWYVVDPKMTRERVDDALLQKIEAQLAVRK
jgi:Domain of unknown function (DUF4424)